MFIPAAMEKADGVTVRPKTQFTLLHYGAHTPGSIGSLDDARFKVRLARIQMKAQEKEQNRQTQLTLEIKPVEIEADKAVSLSQLELKAQQRHMTTPHESVDKGMISSSTSPNSESFDTSKEQQELILLDELKRDDFTLSDTVTM